MYAKKNSGKKVIALLLILVLLIGCGIGGTVAYLMTRTQSVENTFVVGNIGNLSLSETDSDKKFEVIPGVDITKDPVVTYEPVANANTVKNVDVYVFVEIDAGTWKYTEDTYTAVDGKLSWSVDRTVWKKLMDNVYYKELSVNEETNLNVIADKKITVAADITEDMLNAENAVPNISFTAYAIQQDSFNGSVAAAWAAVNSN